MKKLILLFLINFFGSLAFSQQWQWARALSSNGDYSTSKTIKDICAVDNGVFIWSEVYHGAQSIRFYNGYGINTWNFTLPQNTSIQSIAADNNGDLLIVGQYSDTLECSGFTLISEGGKDIFVLKIRSDEQVLFLKSYGWHKEDVAYDITFDKDNNIYMASNLIDSINIGGLWMTQDTSHTETLIAKLDSFGNPLLVFKEFQTSVHYNVEKVKICVDSSKNIFFASNYSYNYGSGYAKLFDSTGNQLSNYNIYDFFYDIAADDDYYYLIRNYGSHYSSEPGILKLNSNLNILSSKSLGGLYDPFNLERLHIDNLKNIFVNGVNGNTYEAHSGTNYFGNDTLNYGRYQAPLVAQLSDTFGYLNTIAPEISGASALVTSTDKFGNMYVLIQTQRDTNYVVASDTIHLDSLTGSINYSILKLHYSGNIYAGIVETNPIDSEEFNIWPNPTTGLISIYSANDINEVKVFNAQGEKVLEQKINNNAVDMTSQPNGLYFIRVQNTTSSISRKIIISR